MKKNILILCAPFIAFAIVALKFSVDDHTSFIENFTAFFANGNWKITLPLSSGVVMAGMCATGYNPSAQETA